MQYIIQNIFPGNVFTKLPCESVINVIKLVDCPPVLASTPIGLHISNVRIKLREKGGGRSILQRLIRYIQKGLAKPINKSAPLFFKVIGSLPVAVAQINY